MAVIIETSLDTEGAQKQLDQLQQDIANDLVQSTKRAADEAGDALADGIGDGAKKANAELSEQVDKLKAELESVKQASVEAGDSLGQLVLENTVDKFGDVKDLLELTGTGLLGLSQDAVDAYVKIGDIAEKGASIGAAFGPWGAAAGLAIGGVIGYFNDMAEAQQKNIQKQKEIEQAILDSQVAAVELSNQLSKVRIGELDVAGALAQIDSLNAQIKAKEEERSKATSGEQVRIINESIQLLQDKIYESESRAFRAAREDITAINKQILDLEEPKTGKQLAQDVVTAKTELKDAQKELAKFYDFTAGVFSFQDFFSALSRVKAALSGVSSAEGALQKTRSSGAAAYNKKQAEADKAAEESLQRQKKLVTDFFDVRSKYLSEFVQDSLSAQAEITRAELQAQKQVLENQSLGGLSAAEQQKIAKQIKDLDAQIKQLDFQVPLETALQEAQKALQDSGLSKQLQETFAIRLSTAESTEQIRALTEEIYALQTPIAFLESLEKQNQKTLEERGKTIQQTADETLQMLDDGTNYAEIQAKELSEALKKEAEEIQKYLNPLGDIASAVFDEFIKGLEEGNVALADLGRAAQEALKGVLLSIAKESAAKALQMTAYGIAALVTNPPAAGAFFSSAATHAAVAAAFGLGGAAMAASSGASASGGGGGGGRNSSDLGRGASGDASSGVSAPIVVDLRGAMFPTSDLGAAQQLGDAIAQSIASAAAGGQPNARRLVGRGFIR
jgi:hypothetical protein